MLKTRFLLMILLLTACTGSPEPISIEDLPPDETVTPTELPFPFATPFPSVSPTATAVPPTPTLSITAEPDWSGEWDVYISNANISIVNTIRFVLPVAGQNVIRATWTEGTRQVVLEGTLSEDGRVIKGILFNSDSEVLDVVLTLSPDGLFFTGPADSDTGPGQFCGARPGMPRPRPCRGDY